jgi:hypothetical protein
MPDKMLIGRLDVFFLTVAVTFSQLKLCTLWFVKCRDTLNAASFSTSADMFECDMVACSQGPIC